MSRTVKTNRISGVEDLPPVEDGLAPGQGGAGDVSLDPAQKSLADALRITYRIIQLVMVLLFVVFLASGFETVGEGERGVKLRFGAIQETDLPPGQQFHLPYPVGELVKVNTGSQELSIDRAFFPDRDQPRRSAQLRSKRSLAPGADGSMITGDGNLAHARWSVVYRVNERDPGAFVRNVYPGEEQALVRAAVEQGVVRVVAGMPIDDLLKTSVAGSEQRVGEASLESRIREIAQRTLDASNTGIVVERVTLDDKSPPGFVQEIFDAVSRQTSEAAQAREDSEAYARRLLNETAGSAHERLLELIDAFERQTDLAQDDEAEATLARIDEILDGEVVETETGAVAVSGEVTKIINEAKQYRTDVVTRSQAAADRFAAKLDLYRTNPTVFVSSEWSEAYSAFLNRSGVEVFSIPSGGDVEILMNRNPAIAQEAEVERNRRQAQETIDERVERVLDARRQDQDGENN